LAAGVDRPLVGSADQSDRFLWDLRRLIADHIAFDYVGGLRDACYRNGLRLWLENYGHWGYPAEFLQYGGQTDEVSGEFWATGDLGSIELRCAASAAHIYGKPVVHAEAFTSGVLFQSTPWSLKRRGDWALTEGINHWVLHVYIHQPRDDHRPASMPGSVPSSTATIPGSSKAARGSITTAAAISCFSKASTWRTLPTSSAKTHPR